MFKRYIVILCVLLGIVGLVVACEPLADPPALPTPVINTVAPVLTQPRNHATDLPPSCRLPLKLMARAFC